MSAPQHPPSSSSSGASEGSSIWFASIDVSSWQNVIQDGLTRGMDDLKEAWQEQVEEAKTIVEDTSKFVEDTTKITSELTNKLVEEGVAVSLPEYFKLDALQEKLGDDDNDDEDDTSSNDDEEDEGESSAHGKRQAALKPKVRASVSPSVIATTPYNTGTTVYRSASNPSDLSELQSEESPATPQIKVATFSPPFLEGLGVVRKLGVNAVEQSPWDWDTPVSSQQNQEDTTSDSVTPLHAGGEEDLDDGYALNELETRRENEKVKKMISEEDRDIFETVAGSTGLVDEIDANEDLYTIDEDAVEFTLARQESVYQRARASSTALAKTDADEVFVKPKKKGKSKPGGSGDTVNNLDDEVLRKKDKKKKKKNKNNSKLDFWGLGSESTVGVAASASATTILGTLFSDKVETISDQASTANSVAASSSSSAIEKATEGASELTSLERIGLSFATHMRFMTNVVGTSDSAATHQSSFFDVDGPDNEEEEDPILKQAEQNRINPRGIIPGNQRSRVPILPVNIQQQGMMVGYESDRSVASNRDVEAAQMLNEGIHHTANDNSSWGRVITRGIIVLVAYMYDVILRSIPWVKASCVVLWSIAFTTGCERGRYMSPEDISRLELNRQRELVIRRFLVDSWEFVTSPMGMSVITGVLLLYSYARFRRYGTDAGD